MPIAGGDQGLGMLYPFYGSAIAYALAVGHVTNA